MRSAARLRAPPAIRDALPIHTDGRLTLDAGRAQERTSRFRRCDERARALTGRSGCTLRTWIATSRSASSVSSRIKPGRCGILHWFVSLTSLELEDGIALAGRVSMTGVAASQTRSNVGNSQSLRTCHVQPPPAIEKEASPGCASRRWHFRPDSDQASESSPAWWPRLHGETARLARRCTTTV